jgi:hypothetical protein
MTEDDSTPRRRAPMVTPLGCQAISPRRPMDTTEDACRSGGTQLRLTVVRPRAHRFPHEGPHGTEVYCRPWLVCGDTAPPVVAIASVACRGRSSSVALGHARGWPGRSHEASSLPYPFRSQSSTRGRLKPPDPLQSALPTIRPTVMDDRPTPALDLRGTIWILRRRDVPGNAS